MYSEHRYVGNPAGNKELPHPGIRTRAYSLLRTANKREPNVLRKNCQEIWHVRLLVALPFRMAWSLRLLGMENCIPIGTGFHGAISGCPTGLMYGKQEYLKNILTLTTSRSINILLQKRCELHAGLAAVLPACIHCNS
jgi:hypothetical protein